MARQLKSDCEVSIDLEWILYWIHQQFNIHAALQQLVPKQSASLPSSNLPLADSLPSFFSSKRIIHTVHIIHIYSSKHCTVNVLHSRIGRHHSSQFYISRDLQYFWKWKVCHTFLFSFFTFEGCTYESHTCASWKI